MFLASKGYNAQAMIPSFIEKSKLPHKPGVYIYRDTTGEILYVGKAIDLYHRVASYFNGTPDSPKTAALVSKIASLETIEVLSEVEALILEANLIKKYLPPYNIKLMDDKDYLYIKITNEEFPKVITARKNELEDAKEYFGPFPSSRVVRDTLKKLRRVFPWCSNPPDSNVIGKRYRACFYHHLGLCPGPCAGKITSKEYNKIMRNFSKFMEGKKDELTESLTKEMEQYSKDLKFEEAEGSKKILNGLMYLTQPNGAQVYLENPNFVEDQHKQALEGLKDILKLKDLPDRIECYDISNLGGKQAVGSLVVLSGGDIDKKWYRKFKISIEGKPNDVGMMREVLKRRLKHKEWPTPDLILVDGGKGQVGGAWKELQEAGFSIPLFGLAKRMEWLYSPDQQVVKLPKNSLALRMLQQIRDEAHRFAISYHRKLRQETVYSLGFRKS